MSKKFRGQTATMEIEDTSGTTIGTAVLDNPEITAPEQEVSELRGAGSTEWVDVQKTETSVTASGEVMGYDIDAWDQLIDWDSQAGEVDDSAEVKQFEITFTFESADGSTKEIVVGPGYIDGGVPLGGARDEWIGMTPEFVCQTIISITNTDNAA